MEQPTQKTIAEIQEGDFNVYMKVRVIRKWKKQEWNNHGKWIFHKVEFLMVDEENNVVQGLITKSLIKKYHGRIQEGKTYKIGRFQTVRNHGFHLATTHKYRIRFGTRTTIDEIECGSIPKHGFKFISFEDIISNKLEGRQLIDVIGGVEDYNAVFVHNNTKRMALDLANQDDTQLSFWMWGPYTKDGEHIATNLCHKSEKPVIVMQCVERIVTKGGHIRLSTVDDVSKIYVNPEIPEAHYIRTRLSARPGRSKGVVESKNKTILDESCKTLHEIMCTELAGKYVTVAYLNEIDDTYGWYRNICQKCTSPVGKRHGKWYFAFRTKIEKIQYENQVLAASNAEDDSAVKGIHNDESVEKILTLNMTQESVVTSETQSDYLLKQMQDAENETGSNTESLIPSSKRILFETYEDGDVQDEAPAKKGKSA
ncbi:replication protein A 70 kDa DNA-binding subunit A-like [Silene latifolia]|uniref:replication protein A 70 kDa DNA-binding subunit A-like n=1 Tax=Silene latifolia TaxID=37657 RepID=UPI003D777AEE